MSGGRCYQLLRARAATLYFLAGPGANRFAVHILRVTSGRERPDLPGAKSPGDLQHSPSFGVLRSNQIASLTSRPYIDYRPGRDVLHGAVLVHERREQGVWCLRCAYKRYPGIMEVAVSFREMLHPRVAAFTVSQYDERKLQQIDASRVR